MAKKMPSEIKTALKVLEGLQSLMSKDNFEPLKKSLPAYARQLKQSGERVTEKKLKKAIETFLKPGRLKFQNKTKKTYQHIVDGFVASTPEKEAEKTKSKKIKMLACAGKWNDLQKLTEAETQTDLATKLLSRGLVSEVQNFYESTKYTVNYDEYSKAAELCATDLIKAYLDGNTFNPKECVTPVESIASSVADFATDAKLYKMLVEEYGANTRYQNDYAFRNAAAVNNVDLMNYALDKKMLKTYQKNENKLEDLLNKIINKDAYLSLETVLKQTSLPRMYAQKWMSRYNLSQPNCHNSTYVILMSMDAEKRDQLLSGIEHNFPNAYETITNVYDGIDKWQQITGHFPPKDSYNLSPYHFKNKAYKAAHKMLLNEMPDGQQCQFYAYQISSLLRTEDRILQYLEKWGQEGKQPLHDIIYDLKLPKQGRLDLKSWGDAVLQHGPKMAQLVKFSDQISQPLRGKNGRSYSLTQTRKKASQTAYDGAEKHPKLAELCFQVRYEQEGFDKAVKQVESYQGRVAANDNKASRIPNLSVNGEDFEMPGCKFRKLADGDMKGLLLGAFTSCCQHIDGVGSECAEYGFQSKHSGFYIIEDQKGKVIGQTWAWRGEKEELVFDSLESSKGRVTDENWRLLVENIEKEIRENTNDITAFHVGAGGNTPALYYHSLLAHETAHPKNYCGYRDSGHQYQVKNLIKI